ncbi:hypothetical protein BU14_0465s0015 [Porphyra umbilicalis]|uniref:Uncharacterized protein n=1 Tax=Porphyra umbilicalis TaxID=2786 RepID=A0A1X6NU40_PORUM|nr:hypothetical protein BU14_0465s0015 [Porphyra umbilicalis]|eukprot:OSX72124.1 hypothetical protein BU14_0465s0015 [Porphyra umbilicalis]
MGPPLPTGTVHRLPQHAPHSGRYPSVPVPTPMRRASLDRRVAPYGGRSPVAPPATHHPPHRHTRWPPRLPRRLAPAAPRTGRPRRAGGCPPPPALGCVPAAPGGCGRTRRNRPRRAARRGTAGRRGVHRRGRWGDGGARRRRPQHAPVPLDLDGDVGGVRRAVGSRTRRRRRRRRWVVAPPARRGPVDGRGGGSRRQPPLCRRSRHGRADRRPRAPSIIGRVGCRRRARPPPAAVVAAAITRPPPPRRGGDSGGGGRAAAAARSGGSARRPPPMGHARPERHDRLAFRVGLAAAVWRGGWGPRRRRATAAAAGGYRGAAAAAGDSRARRATTAASSAVSSAAWRARGDKSSLAGGGGGGGGGSRPRLAPVLRRRRRRTVGGAVAAAAGGHGRRRWGGGAGEGGGVPQRREEAPRRGKAGDAAAAPIETTAASARPRTVTARVRRRRTSPQADPFARDGVHLQNTGGRAGARRTRTPGSGRPRSPPAAAPRTRAVAPPRRRCPPPLRRRCPPPLPPLVRRRVPPSTSRAPTAPLAPCVSAAATRVDAPAWGGLGAAPTAVAAAVAAAHWDRRGWADGSGAQCRHHAGGGGRAGGGMPRRCRRRLWLRVVAAAAGLPLAAASRGAHATGRARQSAAAARGGEAADQSVAEWSGGRRASWRRSAGRQCRCPFLFWCECVAELAPRTRAAAGCTHAAVAPPTCPHPPPLPAATGGAPLIRAAAAVAEERSSFIVGAYTTSPRGRTESSDCVRRLRTCHGQSLGPVREAVRNPVPDRGHMQGAVEHAGTNGRSRVRNPATPLNPSPTKGCCERDRRHHDKLNGPHSDAANGPAVVGLMAVLLNHTGRGGAGAEGAATERHDTPRRLHVQSPLPPTHTDWTGSADDVCTERVCDILRQRRSLSRATAHPCPCMPARHGTLVPAHARASSTAEEKERPQRPGRIARIVHGKKGLAEAVRQVLVVHLHVLRPKDAGRVNNLQRGVVVCIAVDVPAQPHTVEAGQDAAGARSYRPHALQHDAVAAARADRPQIDSEAPPPNAAVCGLVPQEGVPRLSCKVARGAEVLHDGRGAPFEAGDDAHGDVRRHPRGAVGAKGVCNPRQFGRARKGGNRHAPSATCQRQVIRPYGHAARRVAVGSCTDGLVDATARVQVATRGGPRVLFGLLQNSRLRFIAAHHLQRHVGAPLVAAAEHLLA